MEGLPMIVDMHEWKGMQEKNIIFLYYNQEIHVTEIAYA